MSKGLNNNLWLGMVLVAALGMAVAASAAVAPPQNQCAGDCSPCLGASDPFCSPPDSPPPTTTPQNCYICKRDRSTMQLTCAGVEAGEVGTTGCGLTTKGTTVISCQQVDAVCQFIDVH